MSPATVHYLDEVRRLALAATAPADVRTLARAIVEHSETFEARANEATDERARIERKIDGLLIHATDQAARITAVAEQQAGILEDLEAWKVRAHRALTAAQRAEDAADRAGALSVEDVGRIAAEVSQRLERPLVKARSWGLVKGAGVALVGVLVGLIGAFQDDPIAFAEAFERIFR